MRLVDPASVFQSTIVTDYDLSVTATAAAGSIVTATLPSVAAQSHYIGAIVITQTAAALLVTAAVPVTVTTTNLPGSMSFDFQAAALAQGTNERLILAPDYPIKSTAVATNTTIVCPATTNVIWKVTVFYRAAP